MIISGESMTEIITKLLKAVSIDKEHGIIYPSEPDFARCLQLTDVSYGWKDKKGWKGFGKDTIQVCVGNLHGFPKGKFAMYLRFE